MSIESYFCLELVQSYRHLDEICLTGYTLIDILRIYEVMLYKQVEIGCFYSSSTMV